MPLTYYSRVEAEKVAKFTRVLNLSIVIWKWSSHALIIIVRVHLHP